jgi:hypothetical protein
MIMNRWKIFGFVVANCAVILAFAVCSSPIQAQKPQTVEAIEDALRNFAETPVGGGIIETAKNVATEGVIQKTVLAAAEGTPALGEVVGAVEALPGASKTALAEWFKRRQEEAVLNGNDEAFNRYSAAYDCLISKNCDLYNRYCNANTNEKCPDGQCVSKDGKCYSEGDHKMDDGSYWDCYQGKWSVVGCPPGQCYESGKCYSEGVHKLRDGYYKCSQGSWSKIECPSVVQCVSQEGKCYPEGVYEMNNGYYNCIQGSWSKIKCPAGQCTSKDGKCYFEGTHTFKDGDWQCSQGKWSKGCAAGECKSDDGKCYSEGMTHTFINGDYTCSQGEWRSNAITGTYDQPTKEYMEHMQKLYGKPTGQGSSGSKVAEVTDKGTSAIEPLANWEYHFLLEGS